MERIVENLSREELFQVGIPINSNGFLPESSSLFGRNRKVLIAIAITGVVVYLLRDDIDNLFSFITNKRLKNGPEK